MNECVLESRRVNPRHPVNRADCTRRPLSQGRFSPIGSETSLKIAQETVGPWRTSKASCQRISTRYTTLRDPRREDRRARYLRNPVYGVLAQSRALANVCGPHQTPISMWSMELKACCAVTLSPNLKATHARRLALMLEGP